MVSLITHWFAPHYTNNHRPKILQPIGLALVVAVFILIQSGLQLIRLSPGLPGGFVLGYASSINPEQVIELTNAERAKAGLTALTNNELLNQAALAKANDMFLHDYWAHVSPNGTSPWVFIKNTGYAYTVAGENLARDFGDTPTMVQAWMDSPTHKANIIHPKYTQIGVAVVNGKLQGVETTLVVQMFGNPSVATAKTSKEAATVEVAELEPAPEALATPIPAPVQTTLGARVVSPLSITKGVSLGLIMLLLLVLTYDSVMISRKKLPRRVGNNWAHIGLFGVILLIIIAMTQGKII